MNSSPAAPKPKKSVALSGVAAGNTALCTVGRTGNDLHYRGYDILDFADVAEFEEVAHLLVHDKLPTAAELAAYKARLKGLRGLPAPATEGREVGDEQREDHRRRMARGVSAQPKLDDLREHLAPAADVEVLDGRMSLDLRAATRHGDEQDRPRRMPLGEPREDAPRSGQPTLRRPHDVGHRARPEGGLAFRLLAAARPRQLPLDLRDDTHQCLLSASSTNGRRDGGARRPLRGPSSRRRSRGTSARPGSRRRRSRRRASTAPPPRPRG